MNSVDTIIVSDVHLGSFLARSKELLETLKSYRMRRLILNGDFLAGLNLSNFRDIDWALFSYIRQLSNSPRNVEVVWVLGNHDSAVAILSEMLGVPIMNEYPFEWNGKRCLVIHGHQFDRFLNKNAVISALGTFVFRLIQRLDSRKQKMSRFVERFSNSWLRISKKVSAGAIWYARHIRHADIVFCGHTHLELYLKENNVEYWNSGCWTDVPSAYITLSNDRIEIRKVE